MLPKNLDHLTRRTCVFAQTFASNAFSHFVEIWLCLLKLSIGFGRPAALILAEGGLGIFHRRASTSHALSLCSIYSL